MNQDTHEHTELGNSSVSGIDNAEHMPDTFVLQRGPDGQMQRIKVRTPGRNTARRQQYLQRDDKNLKYSVQQILDAARRFDHKDVVIGFGQMVSHDLRERHTGPGNYWSATLLNTIMDAFEFMNWRRDRDFDSFPRSDLTSSLGSLLGRLGLSLEQDGRHLQIE